MTKGCGPSYRDAGRRVGLFKKEIMSATCLIKALQKGYKAEVLGYETKIRNIPPGDRYAFPIVPRTPPTPKWPLPWMFGALNDGIPSMAKAKSV